MTQSRPQLISFDEFIDWYPENSEHRYELHNGVIVEMPKPRGKHSEIAGFLAYQLNIAIDAQNLNYFVPKECVVKPFRDESGYEPDLIVLDRLSLDNEPRWETGSIITMGASVRLIVEVVSTNWRDDYFRKASDYEEMGIPEYWIAVRPCCFSSSQGTRTKRVDYLGLGGKRFIGNPKQPTLSIHQLVEEEYQVSLFRENQPIESPSFPQLNLTAEQIFQGRRSAQK